MSPARTSVAFRPKTKPGGPFRPRVPVTEADEKVARAPVSPGISYWCLLAFLILLYANTPFLLPAAEALRPAKVIAAVALLALIAETAMGKKKLSFAWFEDGLMVVFLIAAGFSALGALWPGYAVEGVSDVAKMMLVFFFIANRANSAPGLRGVMWVMVTGGLFPAVGTIKNYLSGNMEEGRAAWVGIFANPNEVAYALAILIPLLAYLAVRGNLLTKILLTGIFCLFSIAIYLTFSRGGLMGLVAVIALIAWRGKSRTMQIGTVVVLVAGLIFASQNWSRGEDFSQLQSDTTVKQRLATTQAGLNMFLDHPVLGVGFRCSVIAWALYAPPGLQSRNALVTHNTFIQVLSETGASGFIPFILLLGYGIYYTRRIALQKNGESVDLSNLGAAVEISLWGFAVCGMSGGYILTWFPYLLLGLAAAVRRIPKESA